MLNYGALLFVFPKILIGSICIDPHRLIRGSINDFSDYLNVIKELTYQGTQTLIFLSYKQYQHFHNFYDNVIMQGFIPHITLPNRLSDTFDTLMDTIFANCTEVNHVNGVVISDHQITFSIILLNLSILKSLIKTL